MAVAGGGLCVVVLVVGVAGCDAHGTRLGDRERDGAVQSPDAQALDAARGVRSAVSPIEPFLGLAGDGSSAYRKIADVWCTRMLRCDEVADQAASFADHATCVEKVVREFSTSDPNKNETEIGCDGSGDVTIEPSKLAKCLRAFSDAGCGRVYRH